MSTLSRSLNSVVLELGQFAAEHEMKQLLRLVSVGHRQFLRDRGTTGDPTAHIGSRDLAQRIAHRNRRARHDARARPRPAAPWTDRAGCRSAARPSSGHRAAGFVHQKVGSRKVPVVAVAAGEGGIERAMGDARKPQRQRMNRGIGDDVAAVDRRAGPASRFGPADAGAVEAAARRSPAIGAPLSVAPLPATAQGTTRRSPARTAPRAPAGHPRPAPPTPTSPRGRR